MNTQQKAHDLIERYVHEVGQNLPGKMRDDVRAELRSLLAEKLEERALQAERPPDEDLAVEIVREFGNPESVAERYLPEPGYLIGPQLYPAFLLVTKIVLAFVGGLMLLSFFTGVFSAARDLPDFLRAQSLGNFIGAFLKMASINLGLLVLVFAIIEWFLRRQPAGAEKEKEEDWDPRELPEIEDPERISPAGRVWRIYVIVALALLVNFLPQYFGVIFFTGERVWAISVWDMGYPVPVLLMNVWWFVALAVNMALLRAGHWTPGLRWVEFGLGVFGMFILFVMLAGAEAPVVKAGWLSERGLDDGSRSAATLGRAVPVLSKLLGFSLKIVFLLAAWEAIVRLWRLVTRYRSGLKQAVSLSIW